MTATDEARVVVTGGSGTLGRRLLERLTQRPATRILSLLRPGSHAVDDPRVEKARLSFHDEGRLLELLSAFQPTAVIHCAASGLQYTRGDWVSVLDFNVGATARLLRATAIVGHAHFVFISSGLVYRDQGRPLTEGDPLDAELVYGASKAAADILVRSGAAEFKIPVTVLRPFSFTGPGDHAGRLFPSILDAAAAGVPAALTSGLQWRDYLALEDVVDGILSAIDLSPGQAGAPAVFNIGSGRAERLRDLVMSVVDELDLDVRLDFGARPVSAAEPQYLIADASRAERLLKWRPRQSVARAVWALARQRQPDLKLREPSE